VRYGLGIDAGGTYTDTVIYDFESGKVLSYAKAITEKDDLKKGINNALNNLPEEIVSQVRLVSLSTTLATNACVEGKGSRAMLLMLGCDRNTVAQFGSRYGIPSVDEIIFVEGGHTYEGDVKCEPDWEMLKKTVMKYKDLTSSFAITELCGNMNPEYEIKAKEIISELTGYTVVTASEVSRELNFMKRAASALINAQLIPLINEFLDAVKTILKVRKIDAQLVIVRGDGSLMSEEFTRRMPVETLLCGPAASVIGASNLSGRKICIVVDMGGTTTDLAVVTDGIIDFAHKGVKIGKWQTGTKSISVKPVGLGGDSLIGFDNNDEITILSYRAAPLSWLADRWPEVMDQIEKIYNEKKYHTFSLCEFYYLVKGVDRSSYYNDKEIAVCRALKNGPLSVRSLAEAVGTDIYMLDVKRLEKHGVIMKSGLTPTDMMHIKGDFNVWDKKASRLGALIMANRLHMNLDELISTVDRKVKEKLYINIMKILLEKEDEAYKDELSEPCLELVMKGFGNKKGKFFNVNYNTNYCLVGIGAPIHVFLQDVAESMGTECIVPENAAVANAIGAITGNVSYQETVSIKPTYTAAGISDYRCYSSERSMKFLKYDEALEWSKAEAEKIAVKNAYAMGSGDVKVVLDFQEKGYTPNAGYFNMDQDDEVKKESSDFKESAASIDSSASKDAEESVNQFLLETNVVARAIGTLKWI
jgi:N-methylhydantoinase A/oxoprolinase/acetone carboxylase beta subunit